MLQKWVNKYQCKPGRWVFEPTDEYRERGKQVHKQVRGVWKCPNYYYHLRSGGHVEALKLHTENKYFIRLDIDDFFGRVNRSRITRCLKEYFSFAIARRIAIDSTVRHPIDNTRWILPYGFVQSPILASIALDKSHLGKKLERLHQTDGVNVSVYVDDIIVSCSDVVRLEQARESLIHASEKAALSFNSAKSQGPAPSINAFNIDLAHTSVELVSERLDKFAEAYAHSASAAQQQGILGYVKSISIEQATHLAQ